MNKRQQKAEYYFKRWRILDAVSVYLCEVRNKRSYIKNYAPHEYSLDNLDNRVNNTLVAAEKLGANVDVLLEYAVTDKEVDKTSYDILLYNCLLAENSYYMWSGKHRVEERNLKHLIGTYVYSRRFLRRYKNIDLSIVKSWLPADFKL